MKRETFLKVNEACINIALDAKAEFNYNIDVEHTANGVSVKAPKFFSNTMEKILAVVTLYDVMWYMICEDDMICINIFRP